MKDKYLAVAATVLGGICLVIASNKPEYTAARVEGGNVHYKLAGDGSPPIVLEAGLGGDSESFDPIFDDLARLSTVFAYDRPGYGASDPTTRPRTFDQITVDLRNVLDTIGLAPPYVLVGHSLGGQYMLRFAQDYPERVAAVVLIDTPHPELYQRLREMGPYARVSDKHYWSLSPVVRAEYDAAQDERLLQSLGDIPVTVITSGDAAQGEFGPMVEATQAELAGLSTRSQWVRADDASHKIHADDPALVVECIRDALQMARERR